MPPKPLDFLQTAAPDATNVHNNIDNLIVESDIINKFYNNTPSWAYGKPYKYKPSPVMSPEKALTSSPINMMHYYDLIKKSDLNKSFYDILSYGYDKNIFSPKKSKRSKRKSDYILSKLKKGDRPDGIVAYQEPGYHKGLAAAEYIHSKSSSSPDTIKFYVQYVDPLKNIPSFVHEPVHSVASHGPLSHSYYAKEPDSGKNILYTPKSFEKGEDRAMNILKNKLGNNFLQSYMNALLSNNKNMVDSILSLSPSLTRTIK